MFAARGARRADGLLGEKDFRGVGLGAGGGVLVDDAGLHGPIHRGGVGDRGGLAGGGVLGGNGGVELLVQRLQAGLDAGVAGGEAHGFARGFDGRFGVGHGRWKDWSRTKTQTTAGESRVLSGG